MATAVSEVEKLRNQIDELLRKESELIMKEKESVIDEIDNKIRVYGIKPRDLNFGTSRKGSSARVPVKYKKGTNHWSGRGRKPKWVEEHITKGGKIEDLLV